MGNDLLQQFEAWKGIEPSRRPDFVEYLKTQSPWIFAHHPPGACFREHVWKINGLYICKGCVVTSAGFATGVLAQLATGWLSSFPEETLGLVFIFLLLPTLLTSTFRWPRAIRLVSRFLLGFLMASALLLLFVTERWDVRLVVIATYLVVQRVYEKKRKKANATLLASCKE